MSVDKAVQAEYDLRDKQRAINQAEVGKVWPQFMTPEAAAHLQELEDERAKDEAKPSK